MGKKSYQIGAAFERRVKKQLEEWGYLAIRTPGSKSPLDVLAIRHGRIFLVQCKVRKYSMRKPDWRKLDEPTEKTDGIPLLAYRLGASEGYRIVYEDEPGSEYSME